MVNKLQGNFMSLSWFKKSLDTSLFSKQRQCSIKIETPAFLQVSFGVWSQSMYHPMPQNITLSHAHASKEQRLPSHPRSGLLWPVLLYVKQSARNKVDLVMLAHPPAARNTHKHNRVYAHSNTGSPLTSHKLFSSCRPPHINAHTRTSEGPMYVRALSKHGFGCYMLQLLPDGLGENILRLLFSLAHRKPSCETGRRRESRREREWGKRVRHISKSVINLKSSTNDPCQPLFLNDCIVPFPFSIYMKVPWIKNVFFVCCYVFKTSSLSVYQNPIISSL